MESFHEALAGKACLKRELSRSRSLSLSDWRHSALPTFYMLGSGLQHGGGKVLIHDIIKQLYLPQLVASLLKQLSPKGNLLGSVDGSNTTVL